MTDSPVTTEDRIYDSIPVAVTCHAQTRPNDIVVSCDGETITWKQLDRHSDQVANGLLSMGCNKGQRAVILAATSIRWVETLIGILKAGLSVVPLPSMLTDEGLTLMLTDADARFVFASKSSLISMEKTLFAGPRMALDFEAPGWNNYQDWRNKQADTQPDLKLLPDDEFNIIYSSGTTGVPKGIIHSHGLRCFQAQAFGKIGFGEHTVTAITTALYANWSLAALLTTLYSGGKSLLMAKFDTSGFLRLCERENPSHIFLVPIQLQLQPGPMIPSPVSP